MPKRTLLIPLALVAGLVIASLMIGATQGAFSAVTSNSGSSFQAASSFCTATTANVGADADTTVAEDLPDVNDANDQGLGVTSELGKNRRALVRFALPPTPAGCTVTSVALRLNIAEVPVPGRTLQARTITSPWTETTVTWNNQPTSTTTDLASTPSAVDPTVFDVTTQFATMYSGTNNGFYIVDSVEDGLGRYENKFFSSEHVVPPRPTLIITYG